MAQAVGMHVFYDAEGDILEVIKNPARVHVSRKIGRGVFVHVNPKTMEIVGFAVHDVSRTLSRRPMRLPLLASFAPLKRVDKEPYSRRTRSGPS
jgi:hypothetical protein